MTWRSSRLQIDKPKPGKVIQPEDLVTGSEDGEQSALFCWAALNKNQYPQLEWLYSVPNGGSRHIAEATKMVATGTRSGVPDIFLPYAIVRVKNAVIPLTENCYHGLYIELKIEKYRNRKNGGCLDLQIEWHNYLRSAGYAVKVCYGWEEARDTLIAYLEGKL